MWQPPDMRLWSGRDDPADGPLARRWHQQVHAGLDAGAFVLSLGGGHEIAWASCKGVAAHLDAATRGLRIGLLNIDAHFDLRSPAQGGNSGTPFRQVAVGIEPALVLALLRALGPACRRRGLPWLLGEVAEPCPPHDIDARSARLAARLVPEMLVSATGSAA